MAKRNPFDPNYAPYGTYEGEQGNPDQWAAAFEERMSPEEAREVLGSDAESAWSILGLRPGSAFDAIKGAFRKLAMQHHPDHGGNAEEFKRLRAAYSLLVGDKR